MIIVTTSPRFEKLEELILCISENVPDIGVTKLEKLLYLCDFEAARVLGNSITGDTYRHFQWGPVPKHFVPALTNLETQDRIIKTEMKLSEKVKFVELKPKTKCDKGKFEKQEWEIIDAVLKTYGSMTSKELVKLTHDELTYKLTERNEDIPYFLAKYRNYIKPAPEQLSALVQTADYIQSIKNQILSVTA